MNYDLKLIKNVQDEISRLTSQIDDLEQYKDDLPEEEIREIKQETLNQLINNTKILEKMQTGDLTTKTAVDDTRMVYMC
jgi:ElaB/YqjD/DUF883 family membrane-anchored ribosome-binding protein